MAAYIHYQHSCGIFSTICLFSYSKFKSWPTSTQNYLWVTWRVLHLPMINQLSVSTEDATKNPAEKMRKAAGHNNTPGCACGPQLAVTIVPVSKQSAGSRLKDHHPVALTPILMMCFEKLVLQHIKYNIPANLDPLPFTQSSNASKITPPTVCQNSFCGFQLI